MLDPHASDMGCALCHAFCMGRGRAPRDNQNRKDSDEHMVFLYGNAVRVRNRLDSTGQIAGKTRRGRNFGPGSQREQPLSFARFIWGPENQAPARGPRGVFEGAAEHLCGGVRPPRRALPRWKVPTRRQAPGRPPRTPGPRGRSRGVPEGDPPERAVPPARNFVEAGCSRTC